MPLVKSSSGLAVRVRVFIPSSCLLAIANVVPRKGVGEVRIELASK